LICSIVPLSNECGSNPTVMRTIRRLGLATGVPLIPHLARKQHNQENPDGEVNSRGEGPESNKIIFTV
jgi:hypothetical protein